MYVAAENMKFLMAAESFSTAGESALGLESRLESLFETARMLSDCDDLGPLLERILTESYAVMQCEAASMLLRVPGTDFLEFVNVRGKVANQLAERRILIGEGISGQVAKTRKIANVTDAYSDERFNPSFDKASGFRTKSILASPMIYKDSVVGVLVVINKKQESSFDSNDERILGIYSDQAAIAVNNARERQRFVQRSNALSVFAREIGRSLSTELTLIFGYAHQSKRVITKLAEKNGLGQNAEELQKLCLSPTKIDQSAEKLSRISKTLNIFNRSTDGVVVDLFRLEDFGAYFSKETKYHQVRVCVMGEVSIDIALSMESLFLVTEALLERCFSPEGKLKPDDALLVLRQRLDFLDVCLCVSSVAFTLLARDSVPAEQGDSLLSMATVEAILDTLGIQFMPHELLVSAKTNSLSLQSARVLKASALSRERVSLHESLPDSFESCEVLWQIVVPVIGASVGDKTTESVML